MRHDALIAGAVLVVLAVFLARMLNDRLARKQAEMARQHSMRMADMVISVVRSNVEVCLRIEQKIEENGDTLSEEIQQLHLSLQLLQKKLEQTSLERRT